MLYKRNLVTEAYERDENLRPQDDGSSFARAREKDDGSITGQHEKPSADQRPGNKLLFKYCKQFAEKCSNRSSYVRNSSEL